MSYKAKPRSFQHFYDRIEALAVESASVRAKLAARDRKINMQHPWNVQRPPLLKLLTYFVKGGSSLVADVGLPPGPRAVH